MSRTRDAPCGTLRIAYELRGTLHWRRPWLVLVQGMGFDRQGWEPVLPKLRRRFRLVLVDNRGFGRSDRSAGSFGVADMAGDIIAVLDHAGIRKAHVMGASLGGLVAQELAITRPERVDGLVLACTAPGWPLAYPMPMASMRLIAATAWRTAEAGAAPLHRKRPVCADRPAPSGACQPSDRAAGLPPTGQGSPVGSGGRRSTLRRPPQAVADQGAHAGPARGRGPGRPPAQRKAARGPHPGSPAGDLPRAGPSALLGGSRRLRRRGEIVSPG